MIIKGNATFLKKSAAKLPAYNKNAIRKLIFVYIPQVNTACFPCLARAKASLPSIAQSREKRSFCHRVITYRYNICLSIIGQARLEVLF